MNTPEEIRDKIETAFPEANPELKKGDIGDPWIELSAEHLKEVAKYLRDDEDHRFDVLMCLSGVHYKKEEELGVTYHLHSAEKDQKISLKVCVPEAEPVVPSVESIWKTADWHEREAYDMVGVQFSDHPNHTRILCPDDWEGHPLRKDYVQQEFYQGIPTGYEE